MELSTASVNLIQLTYEFETSGLSISKPYYVKSRDRDYGTATLIQKSKEILTFGRVDENGCHDVFSLSVADAVNYDYEISEAE